MQSYKERIQTAIHALHQGKPIILIDDMGREDEGDLIFPAENITADMMSFMIRHSSGIVCLALTEPQLKALQLPLLLPIQENTSYCGTPFTLSIDAALGVTTGISAVDRTTTIQAAMRLDAKPSDLARPGHVFPLQARTGGVFQRAGHTEGSVDMMRLAGFLPAAVIAEVMNSDGSVAKGEQLTTFAKAHQLPILSITDVIDYRLLHESLIGEVATTTLPLDPYGVFDAMVVKEKYNDKEHLVLSHTKIGQEKAPLVRIHSACLTGDVLCSQRCDCHQQLHYSLQRISQEGGILIYLSQEGRDIGLLNKMKAYALQDQGLDTVAANLALGLPADARTYYIAAHILQKLNVSALRLLTNNPQKITALKKYGIAEVEREAIVVSSNPYNAFYLATKKSHFSHQLEESVDNASGVLVT